MALTVALAPLVLEVPIVLPEAYGTAVSTHDAPERTALLYHVIGVIGGSGRFVRQPPSTGGITLLAVDLGPFLLGQNLLKNIGRAAGIPLTLRRSWCSSL